jgi:glucosamine--fructose-6-phosphate aminotransferase (isomerizing)
VTITNHALTRRIAFALDSAQVVVDGLQGGHTLARGEITLSEINSQPQLWATALDIFGQQAGQVRQFWAQGGYQQVLFTGCGSTFYLGVIGAALLQAATGVPSRANTASELMLFPQVNVALKTKTLLVCVSRSGTTRETVEAARRFRAQGNGQVLVITCQSDSPLAQQADFLIAIDAAQERSRVQTRTFSSMTVVVAALAALLGGRDDWQALRALPGALERLMTASAPLVQQLGTDASINQFAFLGSGAQYGLAVEAMLKMTEMSRIFSVAYHILEYLHGPRYAADANTLVIGLVGDTARDEEIKALKPLALRRARVLALAESADGLADFDYALPLESGIPEWGRTILYLPPLQLIGFHQAIMLGFDPDNLPFDPRDPVQP